MKRNLGISALFMALAVLMFLFAACGGGGGSSDSGPPPLQYTGITTQVVVDDTNAEELALGAFEGGSIGGSMGDAMNYMGGSTATAADIVEMAKSSLSAGSIGSEAMQEVPYDPVPGDCGGWLEISMSIDNVTLDFSGMFTYDNFCSAGVTMNGSMSFSGSFDMYSGAPSTMTMTFNNLSSSSAADSFTIAGTLTYTFVSSTSFTMSMNMKVKDATNKVHWVRDYQLSIVDDTVNGYVDVTITSGRFYHPDHGYVDIQTSSPLRIYDTDENPSAGVLVITGVNSSASLICSPTGYEIEVDGNGDGYAVSDPADYHIGPVPWT